MAFGTPASRYASASESTTAASGKSSGSISTTSGSLVVVAAGMHGLTEVTSLTLSDTASWTWVKIYGDVATAAGIATGRSAVWVAISNGSSNTITVTPNQDSLRETMSVTEFPADNGVLIPSTTPNNTGTNTGTNPTEPSVTLTTTPPSHGQIGVVFNANGDAMTPGTGFTELVDLQTAAGNDCAQQVQYDLTAPSDGVSDWTGISGESWYAFTMEIQEDAGGTSPEGEVTTSTFSLEGTISNTETQINSEIPFSAFALEGTISNLGVTESPVAEITLGDFSTLVTDIKAYVSGFTEISFSTFDLFGDMQGQITAVIEGVVTFGKELTASATVSVKQGIDATILVGTELTLAAARITQKIGATLLDAGVILLGTMSGVIPLSNITELIRNGKNFVTGSIRSIIKTISRRY